MPPESALALEELTRRSVTCIIRTTEEIMATPLDINARTDLVVGDFSWTRAALKQLGIPMPEPPDYPECLKHLLYRTIEKTTLGEAFERISADPTAQYFVKPAEDIKAFSGLVLSIDWRDFLLEQFPPSFPVILSEVVEMISEYRVYVVDGDIRAVCNYMGPKEVSLDMSVVEGAVRSLVDNDEGKEIRFGCAVDFAVMRVKTANGEMKTATGLIEVNDGFSLGAYEGLTAKDYTDILIGRWRQLVKL